MSISIEKIILQEQHTQTENTSALEENTLTLLNELPVSCTVRLGTFSLPISELKALTLGTQLSLQQKTDEPVDILLHNRVIARGMIVCCGDHYGIQITGLADENP